MNEMLLWKYERPKISLEKFLEITGSPENLDKRFELVNGYIYMMAGNASSNHQRISGFIFSEIYN